MLRLAESDMFLITPDLVTPIFPVISNVLINCTLLSKSTNVSLE